MVIDAEDTIAAVATPLGRSALGIVRISGKDCLNILPRIFLPRRESGIVPFHPLLGKVIQQGRQVLDEAMLTYFERPHSYTREDLAEITCHGNPMILEKVLDCALSAGARLARPGEFTYRAFLNGRMDLVQAEAVQDLITADSLYQVELALGQMDGRLSNRLQGLRGKLIELIALMEGNIDFSEEQHYHFIGAEESLRRHAEIINEIDVLIGTFECGRMIRDGMNVAIAGRPNAGKSSLFNALVGEDRAIVTAVPGTTRDYLKERLRVGNHLVNLLDTAGIREGREEVEQEGVRRSRMILESADLVVFLLDGSEPLTEEDRAIWTDVRGRDAVIAVNKSDLPSFTLHRFEDRESIAVSAKNSNGLKAILAEVQKRIDAKVARHPEDSVISSVRHRDLLSKAAGAVDRSRVAVHDGMSEEFPLTDLHEALRAVGEITGEVTMDDIYQHIFSNFCIGKSPA
jgi:tRNA modification GTPase